jgi:hypothetical protein
MTFEEMERTMHFILEQQAEFAVRNEKRNEEFNEKFRKLEENDVLLRQKLEVLAGISRDLLTVAQIHSRRLDRLDGLDNN